MKTILCVTLAVVLAFLIGWPLGGQDSTGPLAGKKDASVVAPSSGTSPTTLGSAQGGSSVIDLTGKTQCVPSRKGVIAPAPLHPVVEVLVSPGDRVKKGQVLVKLDDDEPQADVRAKKAALQNATISLKEARRYLARIEKIYGDGAYSEKLFYAAEVGALKAEMDERTAKAVLEVAEADLEHYAVVALVDGVVSWLDVSLGTVSRPGTTVWGEILDLSEIDVRCDVAPEQADRIAVGQAAEVRTSWKKQTVATGRVVLVGIAAERSSGLIPVVIRLPNTTNALRCGVPVQVRLTEALPPEGVK